ncbi:hypothetical protein TNCV_1770161 [Trichonephila clavipes]|nr:hypothetical protein TNCV_1770161 [Trichonephila clavipes]
MPRGISIIRNCRERMKEDFAVEYRNLSVNVVRTISESSRVVNSRCRKRSHLKIVVHPSRDELHEGLISG